MINIKMNKMFFQNKRMLFMAGDAGETARAEVEASVKASPEAYKEKSAADLANEAKAKLPNDLSDADKKTATDKIDAAKGKFEALLALVKRKIELKANVAVVKTEDLSDAAGKIKTYKAERDALVKAGMPNEESVDAKETEINTAAAAKYENLGLKGSIDLRNAELEELQGYMTKMATMEKLSYEGFPGLADAASKEATAKKFKEDIANITNAFSTAQNADDDLKRQLKSFDFANRNLETAQKETGTEGYLEGAKEYKEMVLAEQEARGAWAQLPFDADPKETWRAATIADAVSLTDWPNLGNDYNKAVESFKKGVDKSVNKVVGDSIEAKKLFKQAADTFNMVKGEVDKKKGEKPKEEPTATEKNDVNAVNEAAINAKSDFEVKYGSNDWAASVKGQADGMAKQLEGSGKTDAFRININKDIARIYNEAGPAIDAYQRVMTAFKAGGSHTDQTANVIYDDANWRFERGNFKEAKQKWNEAAEIYEHKNSNPADKLKSMAIIDGKLQEGTEEKARTLKAQAEAANLAATTESPDLAKLLKVPLGDAATAMSDKSWARAINQYQQIISMKTGADAANVLYREIYNKVKPGEDAYDLIKLGNKYYDDGNFTEAKTYYENAKKAYDAAPPHVDNGVSDAVTTNPEPLPVSSNHTPSDAGLGGGTSSTS